MKQTKKTILLKEDAAVLKKLVTEGLDFPGLSAIEEKLKNAELVEEKDFSYDIARLNSLLLVRDKTRRRNFQYRLTLPDPEKSAIHTDHVLRPLGAALLGMKKGEELKWQTNNGVRYS